MLFFSYTPWSSEASDQSRKRWLREWSFRLPRHRWGEEFTPWHQSLLKIFFSTGRGENIPARYFSHLPAYHREFYSYHWFYVQTYGIDMEANSSAVFSQQVQNSGHPFNYWSRSMLFHFVSPVGSSALHWLITG